METNMEFIIIDVSQWIRFVAHDEHWHTHTYTITSNVFTLNRTAEFHCFKHMSALCQAHRIKKHTPISVRLNRAESKPAPTLFPPFHLFIAFVCCCFYFISATEMQPLNVSVFDYCDDWFFPVHYIGYWANGETAHEYSSIYCYAETWKKNRIENYKEKI